MLRSTWLTVFVVELAVISIINGFTILTFARNRHLRKRTKYLIINLSIADFFVGTVSGPMHIYHTMAFEPGSGFGWGKFIVLFLEQVFTTCSLLHLARIAIVGTASCDPISDQTLFNVGLGLLQGCCLHLDLSCYPSIRLCGFISDCTRSQSIRLGFAHNSCAFHRHCLLCDNCSEFETKSPFILIWCSVIRKETYSHDVSCDFSQHTCFSSLFLGRCPWKKHKIARFIRSGPV